MATRKFAADDANLNTGSIITSRERKYIDVDMDFSANPVTGDIYKKKDANAVKTAIKTLILTDLFERPFQPFVGTNVNGMLFELADDATNIEIRETIRNAIENYEPRAKIINIVVNSSPDLNSLDVTIMFQVITTKQNVTLTLSLNRLR